MANAAITEQQLNDWLLEGKTIAEIADLAAITPDRVRRKILRLGAIRAGAIADAANEILTAGINHAMHYYILCVQGIDLVDQLADEMDTYEERKTEALRAIIALSTEYGDNDLFSPNMQKMLREAASVTDPRPLLLGAMKEARANIQVYVDMYKTFADINTLGQFKAMVLELMELDDPRVAEIIAKHMTTAEQGRAFLAVDRYTPPGQSPAAHAQLPNPQVLQATARAHGIALTGKDTRR